MKLWSIVEKMPSTNTRIAVSLILALATGARVIVSHDWTPGYEWLGFLTLMMGLDVVQFTQKRKTQREQEPSTTEPGA